MTMPEPTPQPASDHDVQMLRLALKRDRDLGRSRARIPFDMLDALFLRIEADATTIAARDAEIVALKAQHAADLATARAEGAEVEGQRLRDAAVAEADFYQTEEVAGPAARAVVDAIDAAIRARGGSDAG